ncbi:SDR family oxidoreductase [Candidatus Chloroploca sp. M-50]|uniref:SDR family oxidoreductase n=1 Tax=Candidatus Chloroploca mongolica TaxID=2528176 RepID=A0ABS4D923_9CHLR|nr:SDR family oxidoreductase [Candidatus Chloroploca mongolica]MBP1465951.1 SDR family oxidoreductase [Candidatus Chloroploca mongolica]
MGRKTISLRGRVAVITGSTRGIGRAMAECFGTAGARVVVSSSRPEAVAATVEQLRAEGIDATGMACDVAERKQVEQLFVHALSMYRQVDIWVNNAAISGPFGRTLDVPQADWERVIQVNLMGTYYGCVTVLPHMLERNYGKVINVTGGGFRRAQRFLGAYSVSKAGVVRLTESMAREHAKQSGLSFNVLAPGIVPTDMTNEWEALGEAAEALQAFPRIKEIFGTTTEETALLALKMASAKTDGVSGKVFEVMPRHRSLWRLLQAALKRR